MPVTFVAAGTAAIANNASVSPDYPAGWQSEDLLLVIGTVRAPARTFAAPAEWSTTQYVTNSQSSGPRIFYSWKVAASGDDTTPTFTAGGTSLAGADVIATVLAFRDADPSGLTVGTGYTSGATSQNIGAVSGIKIVNGGIAVLVGAQADDQASTPVTPTGWTPTFNEEALAGNDVSLTIFRQDVAPDGTTASATWDGNPTANAHSAGIQIGVSSVWPKTVTLEEPFSFTDTTRWSFAGNAGVSQGKLTLDVNGVRVIEGARSLQPYDLVGSSIFTHFTRNLNTTGQDGIATCFALEVDPADQSWLLWGVAGTMLYADYKVNGTSTRAFSTPTISMTTHAYWQIAESGGTVTWSTSSDGVTWTSRASAAVGISKTALYVHFYTFMYDTNLGTYNGTNAEFSSVNLLPYDNTQFLPFF